MSAPNANTLWAQAIVDELVKTGIASVVIAPGSRSTPLTLAFTDHDTVDVYSVLDERSAAYFALGRGRRTGEPTPVVTTSGTATANLHPAVMEADAGRVPLLLLTADRPPELRASGANQTVDQTNLYGDAVRWFRDPGLPEANDRALRSLRTTVDRAVAATTRAPAGPVHLNLPFRKPLEPVEVDGEVPANFAAEHPAAATGRAEAYVTVRDAARVPDAAAIADVGSALNAADRPLIVCGPTPPWQMDAGAVTDLAAATDAPLVADPLSDLRFGPFVDDHPVITHYDAYLTPSVTDDWPPPDLVLRFGASPTSKVLRRYLGRTATRQVLVDPAGDWREAEFRVTDHLTGDIGATAAAVIETIDSPGRDAWRDRWVEADTVARETLTDAPACEGTLIQRVTADAPAGSTLVVSNSTPIRDLDRFAAPRSDALTTIGNRGASGIDGVTSTGLGAGSTTDDPLVIVVGDLAYFHDMNGLLTIDRCDVDATIVVINNDGGGIFDMLPIADYDPPFTEHFRTPHGLEFGPTATLYGFDYVKTTVGQSFTDVYRAAVNSGDTQVIEVVTDAESSHEIRQQLADRIQDRLQP